MTEITAVRLRNEGSHLYVDVEQRGRFVTVIREFCPDILPISHIAELGSKSVVMCCTAEGLKTVTSPSETGSCVRLGEQTEAICTHK